MALSHYRKQRIMLLARLNFGLASEEQEEIDLYNHYQENIYSEKIRNKNNSNARIYFN